MAGQQKMFVATTQDIIDEVFAIVKAKFCEDDSLWKLIMESLQAPMRSFRETTGQTCWCEERIAKGLVSAILHQLLEVGAELDETRKQMMKKRGLVYVGEGGATRGSSSGRTPVASSSSAPDSGGGEDDGALRKRGTVCWLDGCTDMASKTCSKCHVAEYCSRDHQVKHGTEHRETCTSVRTSRKCFLQDHFPEKEFSYLKTCPERALDAIFGMFDPVFKNLGLDAHAGIKRQEDTMLMFLRTLEPVKAISICLHKFVHLQEMAIQGLIEHQQELANRRQAGLEGGTEEDPSAWRTLPKRFDWFACCLSSCEDEASKVCSKCQVAWYCSREHQVADWDNHKRMCQNVVRTRDDFLKHDFPLKELESVKENARLVLDSLVQKFEPMFEAVDGYFREAVKLEEDAMLGALRTKNAKKAVSYCVQRFLSWHDITITCFSKERGDKIRASREELQVLVESLDKKGSDFFDDEKFDLALKCFNEAVHHHPTHSLSWWWRGRCYFQLEQFDRALSEFDEAIRLDPTPWMYYEDRGATRLEREELELAVTDLTESIRKADLSDDPWSRSSRSLYVRGSAYFALGNFAHALEDLSESLRLGQESHNLPLEMHVLFLRARVYVATGNSDSLALADISMRRVPPTFSSILLRGIVQLLDGSLDSALQTLMFEGSFESDGFWIAFPSFRALVHWKRGNLADAEKSLLQGFKEEGSDFDLVFQVFGTIDVFSLHRTIPLFKGLLRDLPSSTMKSSLQTSLSRYIRRIKARRKRAAPFFGERTSSRSQPKAEKPRAKKKRRRKKRKKDVLRGEKEEEGEVVALPSIGRSDRKEKEEQGETVPPQAAAQAPHVVPDAESLSQGKTIPGLPEKEDAEGLERQLREAQSALAAARENEDRLKEAVRLLHEEMQQRDAKTAEMEHRMATLDARAQLLSENVEKKDAENRRLVTRLAEAVGWPTTAESVPTLTAYDIRVIRCHVPYGPFDDSFQEIGVGSFGTVYRWERDGGIAVALKVLAAQADADQLESTVRALQRAVHPNLSRLVSFSMGRPICFVTELYHTTISKLIADGRLSDWPVKMKILRETVLGLSHLHACRIMHRDLKWENVMVSHPLSDPMCRAVVIDYGLVWVRGTSGKSVQPSEGGTSGFMAPELFDVGAIFSFPADIYAFGIMMYELIAETTTPYGPGFPTGGDRYSELAAIKLICIDKLRPDADGLRKELREDRRWVVRIMESCWSANPLERFTFHQITHRICRELKRSEIEKKAVAALRVVKKGS